MTKIWEKLESKSSDHYPNSWLISRRLLLYPCHLKKLVRAQEDQIKLRSSELFDSETLEQYSIHSSPILTTNSSIINCWIGVWNLPKLQLPPGSMINASRKMSSLKHSILKTTIAPRMRMLLTSGTLQNRRLHWRCYRLFWRRLKSMRRSALRR